jgi:hypothetical protein
MEEEQLKQAIKNAQGFALIPVLQLLKHITGVDFGSKVGVDINKKASTITISSKSKDNNSGVVASVDVGLEVVDGDYDIMKSFNESRLYEKQVTTFLEIEEPVKEQTVELVSYLLKCAMLVFNELKNEDLKMEIAEHQMDMDENTRLYIISEDGDKKMISVVFRSTT